MNLMREKIINNLKRGEGLFCTDSREWAYSDANKYVQLIINYFKKRNTKRIAVEAYQNFYSYVLLIAAYLENIVFCCYDPNLPLNRKKAILNDYEPDAVIFGGPEIEAMLDESVDNVNAYSNSNNKEKNFDNDIAYVIYTSGTTGSPKGVVIRCEALEKVVFWGVDQFGLTNKDILAQYAPLWFDMSMFDLFGGVVSGAQIIPFATRDMKLMPGVHIKSKKITFWNSVPQAFYYIRAKKQMNSDYLGSLRAIKFGGDCVLEPIVEDIFNILPNVKIFITYGPTEGTIFATSLSLSNKNYKYYYKYGRVPIGNVISGMKIELVNLCNGIGEILLKGNNISSGYTKKMENKNFVIKQIGNKVSRAFYTGDYAYLHDDCYYFVGRHDSQVKISGNRIDLLEIEALLAQENISSYCFIFGNHIVLVYEDIDNKKLDYICNILKNNLPEYSIPKMIVPLEELPTNSNGKIDKNVIQGMIKYGK